MNRPVSTVWTRHGHNPEIEDGQESVDEDDVRLREREEMCLRMAENGKSYGDIEEDTGIPKSTVGDMVRRARDRAESSD